MGEHTREGPCGTSRSQKVSLIWKALRTPEGKLGTHRLEPGPQSGASKSEWAQGRHPLAGFQNLQTRKAPYPAES